MKKFIFLTLGIISFSMNVWACDLCSIYMNLEPNDLKNSFGMNYRVRSFDHHAVTNSMIQNNQKHAIDNTVLSKAITQRELFKSYDLWINYFVKPKWQLFANISFSDNSYFENDSLLHNISGPGDLTLIVKHLVYNTKSTDTSKYAMRFQLGGGVKLPTGTFNKGYTVTPFTVNNGNKVYGDPSQELDPHMQAGTGSLDFILMTEFMIRRKGLGYGLDASYRINTTNSNRFRFANRLNLNSSLFYQFKIGKTSLLPILGLSLETSNRDQYENNEYLNSGGNALFLSYGTKFYINKFAIGAAFWDPIRQSLNDNQLLNQHRITADLTYYF